MRQRLYDYTAMPIGAKSQPYKQEIVTCQKCGRPGAFDGTRITTDNKQIGSVTHGGRFTMMSDGISFFAPAETCEYEIEAADA